MKKKRVSCEIIKGFNSLCNNIPQPKILKHLKQKPYDIFQIDKTKEMHLAERIQIPFSTSISEICKLAKKLRNRAVFIGRQLYFFRNGVYDKKSKCKRYHPLAKLYPDLATQLLSFMERLLDSPELFEELKHKLYSDCTLTFSGELNKKLRLFEFYKFFYHFLKNEDVYENLKAIYSPLPQQVLIYVAQSWKSYYKALEEWKIHPEKFPNGKPRIPNTKRKYDEFLFSIPGMFFNNETYAKGIIRHYEQTKRVQLIKNKHREIIKKIQTAELKFPDRFLENFPSNNPFPIIRTRIDIKSVIEVRILPKKSHYVIEIIYPKKIITRSLDEKKSCTLDIGVNNLIALTTNFGTPPVLVRGRNLKSRNQWMNKRLSKLKSIQMKGKKVIKGQIIPETLEMARIRNARINYIMDYFHKTSNFLIQFCLNNKVGNIGIGYNFGWKQRVNLGKRNTQNFVYIPFARLINMIKYKAQLNGIKIKIGNESHTSKCSAVDFESIKHHDKYMGSRGIYLRGKNKQRLIKKGKPSYKIYKARGLFRTKDGYVIHSDVNGSFNIGRVLYPHLFNEHTLSVDNMLLNPISVEI